MIIIQFMNENKFTAIQIQGITADTLLGQIKEVVQELIPKPQPQNTTDRLLTCNELCEMLKISEVTRWKWTKDGVLTGHRIGNKLRYKESEVLQALQNTNPKNTNNE